MIENIPHDNYYQEDYENSFEFLTETIDHLEVKRRGVKFQVNNIFRKNPTLERGHILHLKAGLEQKYNKILSQQEHFSKYKKNLSLIYEGQEKKYSDLYNLTEIL